MRRVQSEIEIDASAERVWEVLMDFDAYPEWNPFIKEISGVAEEFEQLNVRLQPPGGMETKFKPRIVKLEPNRELRWRGKPFLPGLFDGEHAFLIHPLGPEKVRLEQGEAFGGILVPVLGFLFGVFEKTAQGFYEMNQALKERAESEEEPEKPAAEEQPKQRSPNARSRRHYSSGDWSKSRHRARRRS